MVAGAFELARAGLPGPSHAHGFGDKPDLPVPETLYWVGCIAAIALSFVLAALFTRRTSTASGYPTHDLLRHRAVRAMVERASLLAPLKAASVFLLLLTIATGLAGSQAIVRNWAPTFVLVIWWIGMTFVQVGIGNVWRVVNPWKALFEALAALGIVRPRAEAPCRYPARLGVWPALVLFLGVVWLELIFPDTPHPRTLGVLAVAYSVVALTGMYLFGMERWLHSCDPFAVFFAYLSRLSPTEVRVVGREVCRACSLGCEGDDACVDCYECFARAPARQLNLRPYAAGLLTGERIGADRVAFIVLMLSAVTFDGLIRTIVWFDRFDIPKPFDPSLYVLAKPLLARANTLALIIFFLAFLAVYYVCAALVGRCAGTGLGAREIARRFVIALVPIAVVYQLAHYTLFFALNGQLIVRLISDPFGVGWNLFGTRLARLSLAFDPVLVWNYQIAIIVIGHVVAVYAAHLIALRAFGSPAVAVRSQLPMLAVMILYTLAGLWLLSTPSI